MSQSTTLEKVESVVLPVLQDMALELVDIEYKREGRDWVLRLFIDKEGGVTLDDCVAVSREVGAILEIEDFIQTAYRLEVSSPGLDRPLKKPSDFQRFVGERVKIKTFAMLDPDDRGHQRKTFGGTLLRFEDGRVTLRQLDKKGGEVTLALEDIAKANLDPEFDF